MKKTNDNEGNNAQPEMSEAEKNLRQSYLDKHLAKANRRHSRTKQAK